VSVGLFVVVNGSSASGVYVELEPCAEWELLRLLARSSPRPCKRATTRAN
jgi:hypothetical protein